MQHLEEDLEDQEHLPLNPVVRTHRFTPFLGHRHESSVAVTWKGTHYRRSSPAVTMNNQTCCLGAEEKRRKSEGEKEGKKEGKLGRSSSRRWGGERSARLISHMKAERFCSALVLRSSSPTPPFNAAPPSPPLPPLK